MQAEEAVHGPGRHKSATCYTWHTCPNLLSVSLYARIGKLENLDPICSATPEFEKFGLNRGPIVMIYPCMSFQRGLLASNMSITPLT